MARLLALHLLTLLVLASQFGCQAPEPTKADVKKPDPMRVLLEKQGYVAVELIQPEGTEQFLVECKSGDESWLMKLDTASQFSSLDEELAKKLGAKLGTELGEEVSGNVFGVPTKARPMKLSTFSIGQFDFRKFTSSYNLLAIDYSPLRTKSCLEEVQKTKGLLGHNTLRQLAAIVDYPNRTLYLQPPVRRLWPIVEGKWTATDMEENGEARTIDPKAAPTVDFSDEKIDISVHGRKYSLSLHALQTEIGYRIAMYKADQDSSKDIEYVAGGLLKVEKGCLTLCLTLDPATSQGMPENFSAPTNSGLMLLKCQRLK